MEIQLGVIEARYADMIWEKEPVTSSELVKMTAVEFNWKRTTAHNVLRRLIFGEVSVKERVQAVLKHKKPAAGITIIAVFICIIIAVCFLTNPSKKYHIRITIPAGSTERFCYSDEEISPKGASLTIENGDGLSDTEVILLPVEVREENAYEAEYMTPGMPVKLDVEEGAWYKIGVNVQNSTSEDIAVYVSVRNVDIRIASEETLTVFKGMDDCSSLVFGSYGGYSISEEADKELWEMSGLKPYAEERLNMD